MVKLKKYDKKLITKGMLVIALILLTSIINISNLSLAQPTVTNFGCDAEQIGSKRYKADVYQVINFSYVLTDAFDSWVIMGDSNVQWGIAGSSFSYNYSIEGIYNITLWVIGMGSDSDWLIIEVENDAPEFDIGLSIIEYHEATYDFEDIELGEIPNNWNAYQTNFDFYANDFTYIFGTSLEGSVNDLKNEDGHFWKIRSDKNYQNDNIISINPTFPDLFYDLLPGNYKFYFSANQSFTLVNDLWDYTETEILFNGDYSNGDVINIKLGYVYLYSSFEGDDLQDVELDWLRFEAVENGVEVIKDVDDHGKITQISLINTSINCGMNQIFSVQPFGSIEFWYKTINTSLGGKIYSNLKYINFEQHNNKWFINGLDITAAIAIIPEDYTWYHIRIDWRDINAPLYLDLDPGEFQAYINDIGSGKLILSTGGNGISSINFETNGTMYIDAIGFTWQGYEIGDNIPSIYPDHLYEDHEITFSVYGLEESLYDKRGFSYNSLDPISNNFTYIWDFGNGNFSNEESPTYLYSNAGDYTVRLTLVDDQGAMTTKIRPITIESKKPEADIWYGINYDVTYDFASDLSGSPPSRLFTRGEVKVSPFKDKFSKILEIDTRAGGTALIRLPDLNEGFKGSIEFWVYFSDVLKDNFIFWADENYGAPDSGVSIDSYKFGLSGGNWKHYTPTESLHTSVEMNELTKPNSSEWIHVRFDYGFSFGEYNGLVINQTKIFINGQPSNIYENSDWALFRKGFVVKPGSHVFIDSIGLTSDPDYNLGDNDPSQFESHYGTWDFRFYPSGEIPYDNDVGLTTLGPWALTSYGFGEIAEDCSANIIPELDGHYKVLELQDNNDNDVVVASLVDLTDPKYGSIECWLRTTDISQGFIMTFGYEVFRSGIWLGNDGKWWYKDEGLEIEVTDVPQMQDNSWHHLRLDFETREGGNYLGLEENQFYFWVDGVISNLGPFDFNSDVSKFRWHLWSTEEQGNNYSLYLDAVGVSWDPAYEVGDNLFPRSAIYSDTPLIFSANLDETLTDKQDIRYFWNFGDNQTGFGQTILHNYGRPGKYVVKLTTIDDNGLYDITEQYICIDNFYPEIEIHKIPYGVTFDFTNDEIGEFPEGLYKSPYEASFGEITQVVNEIDGFYNPVQIGMGPLYGGISFSNSSGIPIPLVPGDLNLPSGTVEFWLYTNDTSRSRFAFSFSEQFFSDGVVTLWNTSYNGWVQMNYSGGGYNTIEVNYDDSWILQNNTWTHFRIDFCCDDSNYMDLTDDSYIIYANGHASQMLPIHTINQHEITNITNFAIWTLALNPEHDTGAVYLDNIGLSWDPHYVIGGNLDFDQVIHFNEGDNFILDCTSYDTYSDYQQLTYYWGDSSSNMEYWEENGWIYSDLFMNDDDDYSIYCYTKDPSSIWASDSYPIKINNVLPSLGIHTANVLANISLNLYCEGSYGANFTVFVKVDEEIYNTIYTSFPSNSIETWIHSTSNFLEMDVSRNWDIFVNQTNREGGEHTVIFTFTYNNGYSTNISLKFNGTGQIASFNINNQWIDELTKISKVPLTFGVTVSDPSNDIIDLSINYLINALYDVSFPQTSFVKSYIINHDPFDVICNLRIFEKNGNKYASIEFKEQIKETWRDQLYSGTFPVNYDFNIVADLTNIDLVQYIEYIFNDVGITIYSESTSLNYSLSASYKDLDQVSPVQYSNANYKISDNFLFENLPPSIRIQAPTNASEDQNIDFLIYVDDINGDNVSVKISFGINDGYGTIYHDCLYLGDNIYGFTSNFTNAGKYLVTVLVNDGFLESKDIHLIEIINQCPYAEINVISSVFYEDDVICFHHKLYDSKSDMDSLRFFWEFGDGSISTELEPEHTFYTAGSYNVKLTVRDDNSDYYIASISITVLESPPEIFGPLYFIGTEGQSTTLEVDIFDSLDDSIMAYTWDVYSAEKIYNATYNFMDINSGAIPNYPTFSYNVTNQVNYRVDDFIAGHTKVLTMEDNNPILGGSWSIRYGNEQTVNGTIEFWLRYSNLAPDMESISIQLAEFGTSKIALTISNNGTLQLKNIYKDNQSIIPNIPQLVSNNWHHFRIDFECGNGNYLGLEEDQWHIIVDGISSPNLNFQTDDPPNDDILYLDLLTISSGEDMNNTIYCDAIGFYDESSQYEIGHNLNQILISQNYLKTIHGKQPSLTLNEGSYLVNLTVANELTSKATINLEVLNIAPTVHIASKRFYGASGSIQIKAYAWDSVIDVSSLIFEWYIGSTKVLTESNTLESTLDILCDLTGIIKGYVLVRDSSDFRATAEFSISVIIDKNGDGLSDEYEVLNNLYGADSDGDNLPNFYEVTILGTNPALWDTDGDGLCDGWDNSTLSGEYVIGTNATNPDTDGDNLLDGIEWFGWNITVYSAEEITVLHYTSDPFRGDTDNDGVTDYNEFLERTNPRNGDTDSDGLTDFEEIYKYQSDPTNPDCDNDGLLDSIEVRIGTMFDIQDTDGDGINDAEEYYGWGNFITNPLCKDTDHDFLTDSAEISRYKYEVTERMKVDSHIELLFEQFAIEKASSAGITFLLTYGETTSEDDLADIEVQIYKKDSELVLMNEVFKMNDTNRYLSRSFDIKNIIEDAEQPYYGVYVLSVKYLNEIHGDLCLEKFSIDVIKALNPNRDDVDGDGILDGVETQLLVEGIDIIEYDFITNITADVNSTTYDSFRMEISDIGRLYNAEFNFTIFSNSTLLGNGNVSVEVIKRELDFRKNDISIQNTLIQFTTGQTFKELYHIDLSSYFPNDYSGFYDIIVHIYDDENINNLTEDQFMFGNLTLITDGYREASSLDTEAWITDPESADTDNDGWTDLFEIFGLSEPTNPLRWDTDGDGTKDSEDLFPFYDIFIEISLEKGHIGDLPEWYLFFEREPRMQMTVDFLQDNQRAAYVTPHVRATEDPIYSSDNYIEWYGTAEFDSKYYFNIPDDQRLLNLNFKLWDEGLELPTIFSLWNPGLLVNSLWDTKRMGVTYTHDLSVYGINQTYISGDVYSNTDWLSFKVKTLGLSKPNTIAIYENTTVFNGHYNDYESMHLIYVNVNESTSVDSPFKKGLNIIAIPNSVFLKTKLNSLIQNQSVLENYVLSNAQIMSLDRDNLPEEATEQVESIIIVNCSEFDALEILNLVLVGLVNESTNQTGIINHFSSSKLDGYRVETMNLPEDVLYVIQIISDYKNSPLGTPPMDSGTFWFIIGYFILLLSPSGAIIASLLLILSDISGEVTSIFLGPLIAMAQAFLKVALLIYVYLIFAISFLLIVNVFVQLSVIFSLVSAIPFLNIGVFILPFYLMVSGDISFRAGYETGLEYNEFIGLDIPTIRAFFNSTDIEFEYKFSQLVISFEVPNFPDDLWGNSTLTIAEFINSITKTVSLSSGFFSLLGAIAWFAALDGGASLFLAFGGFIVTMSIYIVTKITDAKDEGISGVTFLGMGIGLLISGVTALLARFFGKQLIGNNGISKVSSQIGKLYSKFNDLGTLLTKVGIVILLEDLLGGLTMDEELALYHEVNWGLLTSSVTLITGTLALSILPDPFFEILTLLLGVTNVVLGIGFIIKGIGELSNE